MNKKIEKKADELIDKLAKTVKENKKATIVGISFSIITSILFG